MLERELKIIDIDPLLIGNRLVSYGAQQTFDGTICDIYFDTDNLILKDNDYSLRIRFQGFLCTIALKKKKKSLDTKVRLENEFVICDVIFLFFFLLHYSLIPYRYKVKKRVSFSHHQTSFDIDIYQEIPPLLEIESSKTTAIFSRIKKLQLEHHVKLTVGGKGLYKYYGLRQPQL